MIDIICAAFDTAEELKKKADYICDKADARPALQKAIDEAERLGVCCTLLPGHYEINSCSEISPKGALCFKNHTEQFGKYYQHNKLQYQVLGGVKPPIGYSSGAIVTMGKEFYNSLPDEDEFSLFFAHGYKIAGRAIMIRNLVVQLPANNKPVIVFDGRFTFNLRYEDTWVSAIVVTPDVDLATAEGIPVPNDRSVAFRLCCGSNFGCVEVKNCVAQGFGTAFEIGGEHVYCESLGALYNGYGFTFDCYKGKNDINDSNDEKAVGVAVYPVTCVNLIDEHNIHLPKFGNASYNGFKPENCSQAITIRGMNIQWPNSAPGYTDRRAADFLDGRHRATEVQSGSWRGSIEYVIDHTTPGGGVNLVDEPFFEDGHGIHVQTRNLHEIK